MLKSFSMTVALSMFHFGQFSTDINKGSIGAAVSGGDGKGLALMEPVLLTNKWGVGSIDGLSFGCGFIAETSVPLVTERWTTALDTQIGTNDGMFIFMIDLFWLEYVGTCPCPPQRKCLPIPVSKDLESQKNWLCFHRSIQHCIDPEVFMAAITRIWLWCFRLWNHWYFGTIAHSVYGRYNHPKIVTSASQIQVSEEEFVQHPKRVWMTYGQLAIDNRLQQVRSEIRKPNGIRNGSNAEVVVLKVLNLLLGSSFEYVVCPTVVIDTLRRN